MGKILSQLTGAGGSLWSPPARLRPLLSVLCVVAVLAACGWVLAPATQGPPLFDDVPNLSVFDPIRDLSPRDQAAALIEDGGLSSRPLALLSFVPHNGPNGLDIAQAKKVNLMVHLINGLLLFALVLVVAQRTGRTMSLGAATAAMAIFVLHPINHAPIYLTIQRMTSLSTAVMLITLLGAFVLLTRPVVRMRDWSLLSGFLVALPLVGFCIKQNAVLVYSYLALLMLLLRPGRYRAAMLVLLWAPSLMLAIQFAQTRGFSEWYAERAFTLGQRLLTEPRVLVEYLASMVWPWGQVYSVFQDNVTVSTGLLNPPTTLPAIAFIALLGFVAGLIRKTVPMVSLALGAFVFGHVIESTVVPLEMKFQHRNYSVAAIVCIGVAFGLQRVFSLPKLQGGIAQGLTVGLLLALGMLANAEAKHWRSERAIFAFLMDQQPDSSRANIEMSKFTAASGRLSEAVTYAKRASELDPTSMGAFLQYANLKWIVAGADTRDIVIVSDPDQWRCRDNLIIPLLSSLLAQPDAAFQIVHPLISAAIATRLARKDCQREERDLRYLQISISARRGAWDQYFADIGDFIRELPQGRDLEHYCSQIRAITLGAQPARCVKGLHSPDGS